MPAEGLLADVALRAWAIASVVVALKTMAVGVYTSSIRLRKSVYISPEDYAMQGLPPAPGPDSDVERARRIHQNDLENGLPFFVVGFVYALTGPSTTGLWICFAGFPIARILHTLFYARGRMPHRTIAFGAGFAITLWMAGSALVSILF
jgi:glutathione S-transferase